MLHKLAIFILISTSIVALADNYPAILLEKDHLIFIETGSNRDEYSSQYAFVTPKGKYSIQRMHQCEGEYSKTLSVLESVSKKEQIPDRYHLKKGFAFFRTSFSHF